MAYTESKANMNGPNMYIYRSIIDVCGLCGDYKKSRNIYEVLCLLQYTDHLTYLLLKFSPFHDLGRYFIPMSFGSLQSYAKVFPA